MPTGSASQARPFTRPVLELFEKMLGQLSVSAGSDDFEETAKRISTAKKQLAKELGRDPKRAPNRAERRAAKTPK